MQTAVSWQTDKGKQHTCKPPSDNNMGESCEFLKYRRPGNSGGKGGNGPFSTEQF